MSADPRVAWLEQQREQRKLTAEVKDAIIASLLESIEQRRLFARNAHAKRAEKLNGEKQQFVEARRWMACQEVEE